MRTAKPDPGADVALLAVYDDHSDGEYGRKRGLHVPSSSFTAKNLVPYLDGALGPRSGLQDINPTGRANGLIGTIGSRETSDFVWYTQGTAVRRFQFNGAIATMAGALAAVPNPSVAQDWCGAYDDTQYLVNPGDKCYSISQGTGANGTVAALTGSPAGRAITQYGDRLVVGGNVANPYRLFYSDAANFNSWPVTNFIDIGPPTSEQAIRGLYVVRDTLVIVKRNGETWVLTGVPGVNETVRKATQLEPGASIWMAGRGKVGADGALWAIGTSSTAPQRFSGARWERFEYLGSHYSIQAEPGPPGSWSSLIAVPALTPDYAAVDLPQRGDIAFVGNNRALLCLDGRWSKHEFDVTVVGHAVHVGGGRIILTDGGGASADPNFWRWQTMEDKVTVKGGGVFSDGVVGDGSDTSPARTVAYPEWWTDPGYEVTVRHVIIDAREYDVGVSQDNNVTVGLIVRGVYETAEVTDTTDISWTPADPTGVDEYVGREVSKRFSFAPRRGRSFQLDLSALRGLAIRRISVFGVVTGAEHT